MSTYPNGRAPASALVRYQSKPGKPGQVSPICLASPDMALRVAWVEAEYLRQNPDGYIVANEIYRTYDEQVEEKAYWTEQGEPSNATDPGDSDHGDFDIGAVDWDCDNPDLRTAIASRVGLKKTSNESWHYAVRGAPTVDLSSFAFEGSTPIEKDWFDMATAEDLANELHKQIDPIAADIDNLVKLPSTQAGFADQIDAQYMNVLGRHADPDGLHGFVGVMTGGWSIDQVRSAIIASDEYAGRWIANSYRDNLQREASPEEIASWMGFLHAGHPLDDIGNAIKGSDEYKQKHP